MKWAILQAVFLILLVTVACHRVVSTHPRSVPSQPLARTYPNTAAGLERLMGDMIVLQKSGNTGLLVPYLRSLVLPDAQHWFTSEFGDNRCEEQSPGANDCMGPRLAVTYESLAKSIPASFALTLQDLIHEGLTSFEATNITEECASPIRIVPNRKLLGGLSTTPMVSPVLPGPIKQHEPVYALWIYSENKETTLPFFVYSEGAFRYLGILYPASFDDLRRRKSTAETTAPASPPHYLTEDQLEVKDAVVDPSLVLRTVVLHVVTDAEGNPREVTYVRGPEVYKESAIEKARNQRFELPPLARAMHLSTFSSCQNVVAPR